jgi:hypothetical protein
MVDFQEVWLARGAIEGDLDAIIFNLIASVVLIWFRFKFFDLDALPAAFSPAYQWVGIVIP